MKDLRELLRQGQREAAITALRRLANIGTFSSQTTASDSQALSGPASPVLWAEVLSRLERSGALERSISDGELARIVREMVAECVRDAISAEASTIGRAGASASPTLPVEDPSGSFSVGSAARPSLDRIGGYIVVRELGAGGFGRVYLCESDDDLRLPVAVKVLHEVDEEQTRRFVAERSILANLRHPNIARYESSGTLADGRPWIAMEYVEGLPLIAYCDRERLSTDDRLVLFQKICDAVHEAHKWGVVHLDIKPANIMVTLEGEPKLLDFGIAKIARSLDPRTRTTTTRGALTYLYSSPEQLRNEPVSTASDVYNLGLVLYELLTGSRARQSAAIEADAFVREVLAREPEPPSRRVEAAARTQRGAALLERSTTMDTATASQGGASRLARKLRGNLDTIVLMAMRLEPSRRYESAKQLAEDVARHLAQVPIIARRHSVGYRLGMQLQRHRHAVIVGMLLLATMVVGSLWLMTERDRRAQAEIIARQEEINRQKDRIIEVEAQARKARRDLERGPDRQLGWIQLDLERNPEIRALLERRVKDERIGFDLVVGPAGTSAGMQLSAEQLQGLVEAELKLALLQRRSGVEEDRAEALRSIAGLAQRFARVPEGVIDEARSLSIKARLLESRAELLGIRTKDGVAALAEALPLRKQALTLADSDLQSRYDYAKLLPRFVENAIDSGDPAALATAVEMLALRESILTDARTEWEAKMIDRCERDVALAHRWIYLAALAANDLSRAEAAVLEYGRMMAERFGRAPKGDRNPEPECDLALALDDRMTVAMTLGRSAEIPQLAADTERHAMSAARRCIANPRELRRMLDLVNKSVLIALLGDAPNAAQEVDRRIVAFLRDLEAAHDGNEESKLRSGTDIPLRLERLQLLQAEARSSSGQTAAARDIVANLRFTLESPQALVGQAADRPIWLVGLVLCRDELSRGQTEAAESWADLAVRAVLRRTEPIERAVCGLALERIMSQGGGGVGEELSPSLAQLRRAVSWTPMRVDGAGRGGQQPVGTGERGRDEP